MLPGNISMLLLCALHEQDADGCALLPNLIIAPWKAPLVSVHCQQLYPSSARLAQDMYALDTDRV